VVNIVTKEWIRNQFMATGVRVFPQQRALTPRNFFDVGAGSKSSVFITNQFGGSLGGPHSRKG